MVVSEIKRKQGQSADSWYEIEQLDSMTYVLHEPNYYQKNSQYLIIGSERALLLDSGSGRRPILSVVQSITNKPVALFNSHTHFDHIGNNQEFEQIAMADLPINREQMVGDFFAAKFRLRLALRRRLFRIREWIKPFDYIDLGNRKLTVLPLKGHSANHVGLLDETNGFIFAADALYHGPLLACFPTANMHEYLRSAQLLQHIYDNQRIYGNHYTYKTPMDGQHIKQLVELCQQTIEAQQNGWRKLNPIQKVVRGETILYVSRFALLKP
ncbi:MBL fold metallo-hydrolase [Alkalihalobacillus hemicellulosilyticus]|uniref:Beta-lactamase-like n=1 Tax=Halalkalibacter hemicellulosilyticusJCM 9152 TaxID=1236971 RepID=W4QKY4_9BACI|nr:MBL fold metallo-hydrolase [Halalkalibacter hemicellulosilyticus]GAE32785.1 beta-lactamase-like [Halalkalibacter hemicellulosilyticusJCM 9152]